MKKQKVISGCAVLVIAAVGGSGLAQAVEIDSWNRDNVVTDLPPHELGVT